MTSNCLARASHLFRRCLAHVSHILERDMCETCARHLRDMCETPTSDLLLNYLWFTDEIWVFREYSKNDPKMIHKWPKNIQTRFFFIKYF